MNIGEFSYGTNVQGAAFGTLQTEQNTQNTVQSAVDEVEISDEAKDLYAKMQANGMDLSEMSPEEREAFLAENPEAAAMHEAHMAAGGKPPEGAQGGSGKPPEGGQGGGSKPAKSGDGGESGGGSTSTEVTTSESSLESEITALELQIAQAEEEAKETGNRAQVDALEAELEELETELDELTEG